MKRKLKVSQLYVPSTAAFTQGSTVPYIRLRGLWLRDAGFDTNASVTIEVPRKGVLIIREEQNDYQAVE